MRSATLVREFGSAVGDRCGQHLPQQVVQHRWRECTRINGMEERPQHRGQRGATLPLPRPKRDCHLESARPTHVTAPDLLEECLSCKLRNTAADAFIAQELCPARVMINGLKQRLQREECQPPQLAPGIATEQRHGHLASPKRLSCNRAL